MATKKQQKQQPPSTPVETTLSSNDSVNLTINLMHGIMAAFQKSNHPLPRQDTLSSAIKSLVFQQVTTTPSKKRVRPPAPAPSKSILDQVPDATRRAIKEANKEVKRRRLFDDDAGAGGGEDNDDDDQEQSCDSDNDDDEQSCNSDDDEDEISDGTPPRRSHVPNAPKRQRTDQRAAHTDEEATLPIEWHAILNVVGRRDSFNKTT